jgi:23S rRNA (guanosine2251-2'-O)-methyltransferase
MELLEGRISVEAALQARYRKFQLLILRAGLHAETTEPLITLAEQQNIPYKIVPSAEIDAMAHGKSHGGVIALCSAKPALSMDALIKSVAEAPRQAFMLLLEGVDDGQNLGYVLRTAEACGVNAVLIKKHIWDFDSGAVSRASSGAFERLPLYIFDQADKVLPKLSYHGIKIYGCIANAQKTMYEVDLTH